jgi:hypothetical protein
VRSWCPFCESAMSASARCTSEWSGRGVSSPGNRYDFATSANFGGGPRLQRPALHYGATVGTTAPTRAEKLLPLLRTQRTRAGHEPPR